MFYSPKEHQKSLVRECSYLQGGIRPLLKVLSGAECILRNPPPLKKSLRFSRFLKPIPGPAYEGMSFGYPVPRSEVIRWPPARDRHWRVQTSPGAEPCMGGGGCTWCIMRGRFELRPSGCQWGGGGNDSLNHRSWLYILFTLAARFWQALLPPLSRGFNAPYRGHPRGRWGG